MREACALLARAHRNRPDWRLSINVSPRQFSDPSFVSDVIAALELCGVAPDRLTLEITENLLIKDVSEVMKIMRVLADRGLRFSVDDFGTGYSSLSYLQKLPIHEIKIDKRFISECRAMPPPSRSSRQSSRCPSAWGSMSSPKASKRRNKSHF